MYVCSQTSGCSNLVLYYLAEQRDALHLVGEGGGGRGGEEERRRRGGEEEDKRRRGEGIRYIYMCRWLAASRSLLSVWHPQKATDDGMLCGVGRNICSLVFSNGSMAPGSSKSATTNGREEREEIGVENNLAFIGGQSHSLHYM